MITNTKVIQSKESDEYIGQSLNPSLIAKKVTVLIYSRYLLVGYSDIFDVDNETSSYLNVGFTTGDDNSTNQTESGNNYSVSGNHYDIDKEQSNLATIGNGNVTADGRSAENLEGLNRDTSTAQQVTKDDSSNTNLYATTTAADNLQNLAK